MRNKLSYIKYFLFAAIIGATSVFNPVKADNDTIYSYLNNRIEVAREMSNRNPDSAMVIVDSTLAKSIQHNALKEKAELLRIKGLIYYYKVDYAKALDHFIESRDLNRQIGNKKGEAYALDNTTLIYSNQGLIQRALKIQIHVLDMFTQIGDSSDIAKGYNNLAVNYRDLKQIKKALGLFKKAAYISISIKEKDGINLYYNNIGQMYMNLNCFDSALYYFNKSLLISRQLNEKQFISNSLSLIGECYILTNNYNKAIGYLEPALKLAKEIGIVYEIEDVSEFLHEAYAKAGNYTDAYKMLLLSKAMADSANNLKAMQKITQIETSMVYEKEIGMQKLEQEKKELQSKLTLHKQKQIKYIAFIVVLASLIWIFFLFRSYRRVSNMNNELIAQKEEITAQKEEITAQRDEIEELNNTKDKFFAIIAHDLRNPLSGIYRLAEIMNNDFEFLDGKKLKSYISMIYNSTQKAYELLENLLQWAMVQKKSIKNVPSTFDIKDVVLQNIELLSNASNQKNIDVNFTGNKNYMVFADKEMINTVIRNLLHNAIKFSGKEGSIDFSIVKDESFWKVAVKDTGIGISADDQKLLFDLKHEKKSIGTSKEKGTGLGLVLCKEFVELNGGKIWIESELQSGSTFFFTVPTA